LINHYVSSLCSIGDSVKAFEVLEGSRQEAVMDEYMFLWLAREGQDSGAVRTLAKQYSALSRAANELEIQRKQSFLWMRNSEASLRLTIAITELELKRREIISLLKDHARDQKELRRGDYLSYSIIRDSLLGRSEALIEYAIGANCLEVFCLTKEGLSHFSQCIPKAELVDAVERFVPSSNYYSRRSLLALSTLRTFDFPLAHRLFKILLEPLCNRIVAKQQLMIVGDGVLNQLPFECLVTELRGADSSRFLIDRYEVTYLNSATSLAWSAKSSTISEESISLCMGNPEFRSARSAFRNIGGTKRENASRSFKNTLPEAGIEVRELAERFGAKGVALIGSDATESAFKKWAGQAALIHLSSHSIQDVENPMLSKLLFASDSSQGEDGDLMAFEIAELDLNPTLVVLSSCGTFVASEGAIRDGLIRGFLEGGAQSIVGTVWETDDRIGHKFMESFYGELLRGKTVSESLRNAKLLLLTEDRSNPYRWANYLLVGRPGSRLNMNNSSSTSHYWAYLGLLCLGTVLVLWRRLHRRILWEFVVGFALSRTQFRRLKQRSETQ
jgi:CHAT domain-containing protein